MSDSLTLEREAKHMEMLESFRAVAAAMTRCASLIEEYTCIPLSPSGALPSDQIIDHGGDEDRNQPTVLSPNSTSSDVMPSDKINSGEEVMPAEGISNTMLLKEDNPAAYLFFQSKVSQQVRLENPDKNMEDINDIEYIANIIAARWQQLSEAEKIAYAVASAKAEAASTSYAEVKDGQASANSLTVPGTVLSDSESESENEAPAVPKATTSAEPLAQAGALGPTQSGAGKKRKAKGVKKAKKMKKVKVSEGTDNAESKDKSKKPENKGEHVKKNEKSEKNGEGEKIENSNKSKKDVKAKKTKKNKKT